MKNFVKQIKNKAKENPQKIVLPEADLDLRVLEATEIILNEGTAIPILLGNPESIKGKIQKHKYQINLEEIEIIDPKTFPHLEKYTKELFELRKHKGITLEDAKKLIQKVNYFGTMLVHMDYVDGMISGTTWSTADTIKPALQIIKTKEKFHKISGVFFMILEGKPLLFADCAIIIKPTPEELAEIAIDTAETAIRFGLEPRVAMLSFSTFGSAKHEEVEKIRKATEIVKKQRPELKITGEVQVDTALVKEVSIKKAPDSLIKGDANILIFPDLNAGNIAYKLVERLAGADAIGPILQGIKKPINDLSRGCNAEDIATLAAFTTCEAQELDYELQKNDNSL